MSNVGERIKMFRKLAGMTQVELATHVGVGRAAINKYEKGVIENIPVKNIEYIAKALNVQPQTLMGWNDPEADVPCEDRLKRLLKLVYGQQTLDLVNVFQTINPKGKRKIMAFADDIAKVYQNESGE